MGGGRGPPLVDCPTQLFYIWIFICCTNLKDTAGQSASPPCRISRLCRICRGCKICKIGKICRLCRICRILLIRILIKRYWKCWWWSELEVCFRCQSFAKAVKCVKSCLQLVEAVEAVDNLFQLSELLTACMSCQICWQLVTAAMAFFFSREGDIVFDRLWKIKLFSSWEVGMELSYRNFLKDSCPSLL